MRWLIIVSKGVPLLSVGRHHGGHRGSAAIVQRQYIRAMPGCAALADLSAGEAEARHRLGDNLHDAQNTRGRLFNEGHDLRHWVCGLGDGSARCESMINQLHALSHRPEKGWDPVPPAHAAGYGAHEWGCIDQALLDELESQIGGFSGKTILDLGGGPGHYTLAMAQRGGRVTWHDVSGTYLGMSRRKAEELGLAERINFSLGYLDEAPRLLSERFDFVFNRICWNYGFSDRSFAAVVYAMVKPGGFGYVDTTHSGYRREELSAVARLRTRLNDHTGFKVGHPMPPHGRLARLFLRKAVKHLTIDYRSPTNDKVLFEKAGERA